jgi:hypothetical protein
MVGRNEMLLVQAEGKGQRKYYQIIYQLDTNDNNTSSIIQQRGSHRLYSINNTN